jgi:putative nucleotidyltransferase with HDIG domain
MSDTGAATVVVDKGIPSVDQCLRILAEHGCKPNIREHAQKVRMVAVMLVTSLKPEANIDGGVVSAGALLHDVTKSRSLTTGEAHDVTGAELVRGLGYPRLAHIVAQHVTLTSFDPDGPLTPEEIVCYSDKRVLHKDIVSLMARKLGKHVVQANPANPTQTFKKKKAHLHTQDLYKRYGAKTSASTIEENFAKYAQLENKIRRWMTCELEQVIPDDSIAVTFRWEYGGTNVKIAGDFTCWTQVPMQNREFRVKLPPGTYSFKYVVDGTWMFDMRRPTTCDTEGNTNNTVLVTLSS